MEADPSWISRIITMEESSVAFHTPETKEKSRQWLPGQSPAHATCQTQMVMAFFDSQGPIYQHYIPRGTGVNAAYVIKVLGMLKKILEQKRPDLAPGYWILHWDNAPVHSVKMTCEYLEKKNRSGPFPMPRTLQT